MNLLFIILFRSLSLQDDEFFCRKKKEEIQRKTISHISSWNHCQRFSPSPTYIVPQAGLEPARKLTSGFVEWSCSVSENLHNTASWCSQPSFTKSFFHKILLFWDPFWTTGWQFFNFNEIKLLGNFKCNLIFKTTIFGVLIEVLTWKLSLEPT